MIFVNVRVGQKRFRISNQDTTRRCALDGRLGETLFATACIVSGVWSIPVNANRGAVEDPWIQKMLRQGFQCENLDSVQSLR